MFDDEMIEEFKLEAFEMVSEAENAVLKIEEGKEFKYNYNSIFRAVHSIKGGAGMFGLSELQKYVHTVESFIEKKKTREDFDTNFVNFLLNFFDQIRCFFDGHEYNFIVPENFKESKSQAEKRRKKVDDILSSEVSKLSPQKDGLIYLVDDETDILEMIKLILEEETNYQVEVFNNPENAVEAFKFKNPDLVISDISMPEMTGLELLAKLQKINQLVPVIILSGFVTKESCLNALKNGASGILEKPCDMGMLLEQAQNNIIKYQAFKLLNRSIDLLTFQFEDFEKHLQSKDPALWNNFKEELTILLKHKKIIFKKAS